MIEAISINKYKNNTLKAIFITVKDALKMIKENIYSSENIQVIAMMRLRDNFYE